MNPLHVCFTTHIHCPNTRCIAHSSAKRFFFKLFFFYLSISPLNIAHAEDAKVEKSPLINIENLNIVGAGQITVHPTLSIGDYDKLRFNQIRLRYAPGQKPLSNSRKKQFSIGLLKELKKSIKENGNDLVKKPGKCVVDINLSVLNISLDGVSDGNGGNFKKSLGSATLVYDMRDSVTNDRLVMMTGKRDFGSGLDRRGNRDDFDRLSDNVGALLVDLGETLGEAVAQEIAARSGQPSSKPGCQNLLRQLRPR